MLPGHQRVAAAVGILMALHHLTATQATDLLSRASQHTHQSIRGVGGHRAAHRGDARTPSTVGIHLGVGSGQAIRLSQKAHFTGRLPACPAVCKAAP